MVEQKYEPIHLQGERAWRTYTGGRNIDRLQGREPAEDTHFPEEWMYSVTRAFNSGREDIVEGLTHLADDPSVTLKELIEGDPEGMLGAERVRQWGNVPGVLIKIIDSAERLTVQVHPDQETAMRLFHSRFGKTECWHILGTRDDVENPCLYMGFRESITREEWVECFEQQDYARMLSLMNALPVRPGETYLVRGGLPHAIGEGCTLVEIQEPTDYTIRVEKVTPTGYTIDDVMCHQGLGFERMFDCFSYVGRDEEATRAYCCIPAKEEGNGVRCLVGYEDTPCFRMTEETICDTRSYPASGEFACLYVVEGTGTLRCGEHTWSIGINSQFFIPARCRDYEIVADENQAVRLLWFYGPALS